MPQSTVRILFVADNMQLAAFAADALADPGWQVVVATGAADAKFLTHRHRFDLVVCGELAAAHAVCEFTSGRDTSVIVLNDRHLGDTAGPIHVAPRPGSAPEFRAAIDAWLTARALPAAIPPSPAKARVGLSDAAPATAKRRAPHG